MVTVTRGKKTYDIPLVMATRAAGITHLEVFDPEFPENTQVGASITHSSLGMVTYDSDDGDDVKVLDGSLDLLLQGHIFSPKSVDEDPGAARIKGVVCSKDLHDLLKRPHKEKKHGKGKRSSHHDDDD